MPEDISRSIPPGRVRPAARALAGMVLVALATSVGAVVPAQAISVHVPSAFFGVHDSRLHSLAEPGTGSIRLWDTGTTWRDIEPSLPGVYSWSRLDQVVTAAQQRNVAVTLVLGMTPAAYASSPTQAPPLAAWTSYVHAVMARYRSFNGKRGIAAYEVWNEGNVVDYWTGTPAELAQLNQIVWEVRKAVDPGAQVISPSFVTRLPSQRTWLSQWAQTKVGPTKIPVWKINDVTALSLYPMATYGDRPGGPEDSIRQLEATRATLTKLGVPASMPIWDTEINYGLVGGPTHPTATPISNNRQAAYVVRTYLLNAAAGVGRVFWYAYDLRVAANGATIANTVLTDPATGTRLTRAGRAFHLVQTWMQGTMVGPTSAARPCAHSKAGTYTCIVTDGTGVKRIYWNPRKKARVTLHRGARKLQTVSGVTKQLHGRHIAVGYAPVMVRTKR